MWLRPGRQGQARERSAAGEASKPRLWVNCAWMLPMASCLSCCRSACAPFQGRVGSSLTDLRPKPLNICPWGPPGPSRSSMLCDEAAGPRPFDKTLLLWPQGRWAAGGRAPPGRRRSLLLLRVLLHCCPELPVLPELREMFEGHVTSLRILAGAHQLLWLGLSCLFALSSVVRHF